MKRTLLFIAATVAIIGTSGCQKQAAQTQQSNALNTPAVEKQVPAPSSKQNSLQTEIRDTWTGDLAFTTVPTSYANAAPPTPLPEYVQVVKRAESIVIYSKNEPPPEPAYDQQERASASQPSAADAAEKERAAHFNPDTCKFKYFTLGDSLGKTLSEAAKEECLRTKGLLGPAYQRWNDHYQFEATKRQNNINNSMNSNKTLNCLAGPMPGSMSCQQY